MAVINANMHMCVERSKGTKKMRRRRAQKGERKKLDVQDEGERDGEAAWTRAHGGTREGVL